MLKKRWKIKEVIDDYSIQSLADSLNITEVLAKLLYMRDVKTFAQAKYFFRPALDSLHDPFLMDGMDTATLRVIHAITEQEKIFIYGDYDVDGTCATALMYLFLKELGADVHYHIPKRLTEGYGITKLGIDQIALAKANLMIAVDCGITAIDEVEYAKSLGIDVIICDHHQPKDEIPKAVAVLDPLKPDCHYPFGYLSGAGVAFKLAQGVSQRIGKKEIPLKFLDLVALASSADIVPLIDENRILVLEGLRQINEKPRPGILALIKSSHLEPGNLSSGQIVFTIAPRINAVGRLGDAARAVELLISDKEEIAEELSQILETENFERRKIDETTFKHALDLVEKTNDLDNHIPIVLHEEDWHSGVIGIVASRLVEKYYRPTIMLTTIDGVAKGSARSITNFNIYEALRKCEDLLIHFGGHEAAAGLAIDIDKLDMFREKFNKIVKESINEEDLLPEIEIDAKLKFSEITPKFIRILDQFSPFGPGNSRPVFLTENVEASYTPRIVGNNHLLMTLKQPKCDKVFDTIGFDMGNYLPLINERGKSFDIVYTIDKTVRDGKSYPQLRLKDLRVAENN